MRTLQILGTLALVNVAVLALYGAFPSLAKPKPYSAKAMQRLKFAALAFVIWSWFMLPLGVLYHPLDFPLPYVLGTLVWWVAWGAAIFWTAEDRGRVRK